MFDMQVDPLEMRNLAEVPEFQMIRKQHREMLEHWCRQTGDRFLTEIPPIE